MMYVLGYVYKKKSCNLLLKKSCVQGNKIMVDMVFQEELNGVGGGGRGDNTLWKLEILKGKFNQLKVKALSCPLAHPNFIVRLILADN